MAKKQENSQVENVFVGMDYSNKCVALNAENKSLQYDKLDYTPRSIPLGQILGETTNDMIEKILLHSGAISRSQWENFKGISYDILSADDETWDDDFDDDFDDSWEQSKFSEYVTESNTEVIPPKEYAENEPPLPHMDTPTPPSAESVEATQSTQSTTETQA